MKSQLTMDKIKYCIKLCYSFVKIPIQLIDEDKNIIMSFPNNQAMKHFNICDEFITPLISETKNNINMKAYKDICIFTSIMYVSQNRKNYILIGPTLNNELDFSQKRSLRTFFKDITVEEFQSFLNYAPTTELHNLINTIKFFSFVIFDETNSTSDLIDYNNKEISIQEDIEEIDLYSRIENMDYHTDFSDWLELHNIVKSGDVKELKNYINTPRPGKPGKLSNNPLRQKKYEVVNILFFLWPALTEKGIPYEIAINLMDSYILEVDNCKNEIEVQDIRKKALYEYTLKKPITEKNEHYSKIVQKAIDYIFENVTMSITIKEISDQLDVSPRKLSSMFKKETGISITDYIQKQKIKVAKNLLKNSNSTSLDISNYLNFSSQSYFIQVFSKIEGITPKKYKEIHCK